MVCKYCGSEIVEGSKYCNNCGKKQKSTSKLVNKTKNKNINMGKLSFLKIGMILLLIIFVIIVGVGIIFLNKHNNYDKAKSLLEEKQYKEAVVILEELRNYKDSEKMLSEAYYQYALYEYQEGTLELAEKYFYKNMDYKESKRILENIEILKKLQGTYSLKENYDKGFKDMHKAIIKGSKLIFVFNINSQIDTYERNIEKIEKENTFYTFAEKCVIEGDLLYEYGILSEEEKSPRIYIKLSDSTDVNAIYQTPSTSTLKSPHIGMSKTQVEQSTWGKPKDINKTTTKYGVSEQWVYSGNRYIYFDNGIVTAIQE